MASDDAHPEAPVDFLREKVRADVAAGRHGGQVVTRFPPEPNGHLHIGHAKAICIDFGIAREFGGRCHLRMDDTNPTTESEEYVRAIQRDVRWLGFDWGEHMYYASDYFERFYELARRLIRRGRAYVCDLPDEEFSAHYRGSISEPGKKSPYRERSADENLDLLARMRAGEFGNGEKVLRAKIDMTSPNMKMRDPPLMRIKHAHHYRTGDAWCLYPLYDFAHCLEDSFEGVTHSLCTLEFESARELYDWVIQATEVEHVPKQTEFARLGLTYAVMSKRKLLELVQGGHVRGWDDPRMPTLAGLRRRGVTPEAIVDFAGRIGVARNNSTVEIALLDSCIRDDLDGRSPRAMCVLRPLRVVIETYPDDESEEFDAPYWPAGTTPKEGPLGSRIVPFCRELFIEREDFEEVPPKGYHRLAPGQVVRLRHAYIVTCTSIVKDEAGEVVEVRCSHDPATRGGVAPAGSRVEGTIHWVSARHAVDVEVRLYDRLFAVEFPRTGDDDWLTDLNPSSLATVVAKAEPSLATAKQGERFQFERLGFFFGDVDSRDGRPVFNRTSGLRDSWAKSVAKRVGGTATPTKEKTNVRSASLPASGAKAPARSSEEEQSLVRTHSLTADEARVLAGEPAIKRLFEAALGAGACSGKALAVFLVNDVLGELRARNIHEAPFDGAAVSELVTIVQSGAISPTQAKHVLSEMFVSNQGPMQIVTSRGMTQIVDPGMLEAIVERALAANADAVARYRAGNAKVFGALVGIVVKESAGRANPKLAAEILRAKLG